jgi:phage terminase small subunit
MDPVTTAILAAVAAGAASGATKTVEKAVVDAYEGLKGLLKRKFGENSEVSEALAKVEAKPDSAGRREMLREEIGATNAPEDPEIRHAAEALLEVLRAQPGGQQVVHQVVTGNENVFSGTGDVYVNKRP